MGFDRKLAMSERQNLNDAVALLADLPAAKFLRGQTGTVVEPLLVDTMLAEFADDNGRAYAITPVKTARLPVLQKERDLA